jgi:hypothetical protein
VPGIRRPRPAGERARARNHLRSPPRVASESPGPQRRAGDRSGADAERYRRRSCARAWARVVLVAAAPGPRRGERPSPKGLRAWRVVCGRVRRSWRRVWLCVKRLWTWAWETLSPEHMAPARCRSGAGVRRTPPTPGKNRDSSAGPGRQTMQARLAWAREKMQSGSFRGPKLAAIGGRLIVPVASEP